MHSNDTDARENEQTYPSEPTRPGDPAQVYKPNPGYGPGQGETVQRRINAPTQQAQAEERNPEDRLAEQQLQQRKERLANRMPKTVTEDREEDLEQTRGR